MLTDQARAKHQGHELYWAADLIVALENQQPGKALDWAGACVKAVVEDVAPADQVQLLGWIAALQCVPKENADPDTLLKKGQEIWHERHDLLHTATAHLYAALAYFSKRDIPWYRRSIVSAMDIIGDEEYYQQTSVAVPLALFERFMGIGGNWGNCKEKGSRFNTLDGSRGSG